MLKKTTLSTSMAIAIGCLKASSMTLPSSGPMSPSGAPVAASSFSALSPGIPTAMPQPAIYEKCFGVNRQNGNACAYASFDGLPSVCAGTAKPCDPAAWVWVPKGMCTSIVVGHDPNGQIARGTLEPTMSRGTPLQCAPYDGPAIAENDYGL